MTAIAGATSVLADTNFGHMGNWGAGWWILMMIGMVVFWGLVILGIVWVVRELSGRHHASGPASSAPLAVLDRRLAEGEISPEDYQERRRILTGSGGAGA